MIRPRVLLTAGFAVILAAPASADRQTGSIAGTVTEAGGGRLRGVAVTLTGATGSVAATTGTGGDYRFPSLTPGRYAVKAELTGFQPHRVEDITVSIARDVTIDFALAVAGPSETVEVVEEAPSTLPTTSSVDNFLTQDLLFNMPFDRFFLDLGGHAPGVHERAFGSPISAVLQDGVETRSPLAGNLWLYLAYNWVDEVQIAGVGAPAEYGGYTGAVVNSVTRSGGNKLGGLFDVVYGPEAFVSDNLTEDLAAQNPDLERRGVRTKLFDVTAQLGGPIVKDKLFFFAGVERRLEEYTSSTVPVVNRIVAPKLIGKLTYSPSARDQFVGVLEADDYNRTGLGGGLGLQSIPTSDEMSIKQDAPEVVWNGQWRHAFDTRTSWDLKYTGWAACDDLFPTSDRPRHYDLVTGEASGSTGSFSYSGVGRHQLNASVSRYAEAFGKHDLKFGLEIERSHVAARGGYTTFYDYDGAPYYAVTYGYELSEHNSRESAFAQDSWRLGRLTLDAGLRADWIRGSNPETGKVYDVWNLQPRIGLNFDPTGTGRWLLKGHWGRYHEGALTAIFEKALPGVEDRVAYDVDAYETLGDEGYRIPYRIATVDPEIGHPYMDELILGLDAALPLDLRLSATGIWRDNRNIVGLVEPGTRYLPVTFTNALTGGEVPTYAPQSPMEDNPLLTNPASFQYLDSDGNVVGTPEPRYKYRGLMIVCRRPYLGRWQAQVSYVWSRTTGTVESSLSNLGYYFWLQPAQSQQQALMNLEGELGRSRRHEVKAMVSYLVPKVEVGLNAYFRSLSGSRYAPLQRFNPFGSGAPHIAFLEPRGAREMPWENRLDLRIEKIFRRGDDRIGLFADIRNVFNASTVTRLELFADDPASFEKPLEILQPRQVVLGARWSF